MRTTNEVIEAVRNGTEVTDEELRYAVQNLALWQNMLVFDLARAITEDPILPRTKRGLQRAWDNMRDGNKVALDVRLKGSSYEPGMSKEVLHERWLKHTSETGAKLAGVLAAFTKEGG